MKAPNVKCLFCGKNCYVPKNRLNKFKYCSRKCLGLGSRVRINSSCAMCNSEFIHISSRSNKAKYCSRKCYYKSMRNKGSVRYKCQHCEKYFRDSPSKKRKYCSQACVNKIKKSEFKAAFSTVRKNLFRRGLIDKCQICGYAEIKEILGVHHIDKNRKNNSIENLMIVCPTCHSIIHRKHIRH